MPAEVKSSVGEIGSLAAQGQGVESLSYPIGVKKAGLPGIVTVVLPKDGDPRGLPMRYFAETKMGSLPRLLALLDMVKGEAAVQGIEASIVMLEAMPEVERGSEVRAAQARVSELDSVVLLLSVEGYAPYAERIACEREAWCRLLDAAGQPYVPEYVPSEEEALGEAEQLVEGMLQVAKAVKLGEPVGDAVERIMQEFPKPKSGP